MLPVLEHTVDTSHHNGQSFILKALAGHIKRLSGPHFGLSVLSLTRGFRDRRQRTAQLMQRLLGVGVPVAALPNVVGFQFNAGLDGCDWLVAGLQVNAGE